MISIYHAMGVILGEEKINYMLGIDISSKKIGMSC